jgi:hypothetical protein
MPQCSAVFMRNGEYDQACENMSLQVGSCWNLSHLTSTTSFHRANSAKQFHTDPFWFHHNGLCLSMCFVSFPILILQILEVLCFDCGLGRQISEAPNQVA